MVRTVQASVIALACCELCSRQVALSSFRLSSLMPTQTDTQSQIARKVNFAIQLLREASELLETSLRSRRSTDEVAAGHSMTSSARASNVGGTSSPSAFAVFRLITSSYLVGC